LVAGSRGDGVEEPKRPPIVQLAIATLVLVVIAGIYVVSYFPNRVPLSPAYALIATAVILLLLNLCLLTRLTAFDWPTFLLVGKWSLLAYVLIAGMLELVFVLDQIPPDVLLLLTASLVVYAIDIPLLFAYSVARFQNSSKSSI
jgi:hypothetical protein